jgi:IS6 family transposase
MQNAETVLGVLRERHTSRHKSLESPLRGNSHGGFGGRPHGKGPAPQAPRRAAHPSVKIAGRWVYLYRAIDQFGQVIDVLVSQKRDLAATRRFFIRTLEHGSRPTEVSTDQASAYPRAIEELMAAACHITEQYANNSVEADHGRLKARLRPMRGLKRLRSAQVISAGHAFVQNLRLGHYELSCDIDPQHQLTAIFTELARAI